MKEGIDVVQVLYPSMVNVHELIGTNHVSHMAFVFAEHCSCWLLSS